MKNNIYRKSLVFTTVFLLIGVGITLGMDSNTSIFSDDFNDGDISDWTVTTAGNGIFETSTTKYVSSPYSAHMKSLNQYDQAMAVSPSYSLDLSEDYEISFYFLVPSTNNHWFEVFNNHQIYLVIDSGTQLKWYDGSISHSIMGLTTNQWYLIRIEVQPSSDLYDIYINSQYKTTCDIWTHSGFEYAFRIGDRNNDQGSYTDYGEAYWDDFEISQSINSLPNKPSKPSGPKNLEEDESGSYSTSATDPDDDQVQYRFDWDASSSHDYSSWTTLGSSGHTGSLSHSWDTAGTYVVKAQAKDEHGATSSWSNGLTATVTGKNSPPETPDIDGQSSGKAGKEYEYKFKSTDPNGDNISYCIDWGDGSEEEEIGPYPSGETATVKHTWTEEGTYTLKAKAKDTNGLESDWATLEVSMPKNKVINRPFLKFLQNHLHLFPILRQLLQFLKL